MPIVSIEGTCDCVTTANAVFLYIPLARCDEHHLYTAYRCRLETAFPILSIPNWYPASNHLCQLLDNVQVS